jgi:hypothetical protein
MSDQQSEARRQAIIKELRRRDLIDKLNAQDKGVEPQKTQVSEGSSDLKDLLMTGLDGAGRVLDAAGGGVRTALTGAADLAGGAVGMDPDLYREGDWDRALQGRAPGGSEILQRAGMDPGLKNSALGMGIDIATDPLTYLSFGGSAAGKAAKAGRALTASEELAQRLAKVTGVEAAQKGISAVTEPVGKWIYKNSKALAEADQKLAEYGKKPLSDILLDNKVWGTAKTIEEKTDALAKAAIDQRNGLLAQAQKSGVKLPPEVVFQKAEEKAAKLLASESVDSRQAGKLLMERLEEVKSAMPEGGFTPMGAQEVKTDVYRGLGGKAYKEGRPITGSESLIQGEKALGRGLKEAQEAAVDQATGKVGELKKLNETYGQLVTPADMLEKNVRQQVRSSPITTVDAMSLWASPWLLAAKKGGDLSKTNLFRTGVGNSIYHYGAPAAQVALDRKLINEAEEKRSPWGLLK